MKKAVIAASVATMLSASVHADTLLGLYVGGSVWDTETTGSFGEGQNNATFDFEDEKNSYFFAALEHPIPLIPNIKIASSELETAGTAVLTTDFEFGDAVFNNGDSVTTDFDISYIDYSLYYEIFDNDLFSFDAGVTLRDFDGDIRVAVDVSSLGSTDGTLDVSSIVPMLYVSTIVGIPTTDFNLFAEGNFLSFDDHTLYDYQAGISYALLDNIAVDFDVTFGYRAVKLELEDLDDLYTDIEFKGLFAGAVVHF